MMMRRIIMIVRNGLFTHSEDGVSGVIDVDRA
jgi:hypothetical protein